MGPDTICAEAYYSGDRWTAFAAMTARAHANVVVFKESFSTAKPVKSQIPSTKSQGFRCRVSGVREEKQESRTLNRQSLRFGIFSHRHTPSL
jgi:hypothetical protein